MADTAVKIDATILITIIYRNGGRKIVKSKGVRVNMVYSTERFFLSISLGVEIEARDPRLSKPIITSLTKEIINTIDSGNKTMCDTMKKTSKIVPIIG